MSIVSRAFGRAQDSLEALSLDDPAAPPPFLLALPGAPARGTALPGALLPGGVAPGGSGYRGPPAPSIAFTAAAIRDGALTAGQLLERALARMEETVELGTIAAIDVEDVRAEASRLDAEAAAGFLRGPLHGIPLTVKDVIDVAGLPTRAGSAAFERMPVRDAGAVARLRAAGGLIFAKAATHEFALGVTTPQCRNPYDPQKISGGSSGGSAVAVATGVGLGSLGTDTRASLRVPASLCGVVGFKPTFGRVPTAGVVPLGWTVDHVGPIAATVADAFLLLEILAGESGELATTGAPRELTGLVVGVVPSAMEAADPGVAACIERQLKVLEMLGCRLMDTGFPLARDLDLSNDLGLLISRSEAATFHRSSGTNLDLCLPEVREQLLLGLEVRASDYLDAQRQRGVLALRAREAFSACDLIACPTTPITAPRRDDYERFLMQLSQNTILWSLVGSPALSMPAGLDAAGMPVGLQLCAAPGGDRLLAAAGMALEASTA